MPDPTSPRTALSIGGAALVASTGVAYLPWVDLRPFGADIAWNGFGLFLGGVDYRFIGGLPLANSLGWLILAAVALGGLALVAAAARHLPGLRFVGLGSALVASVTAVACLLRPELLAGHVMREFGIESLGARPLVNAPWLWSEVAITVVFALAVIGLIVAARRTPPAA